MIPIPAATHPEADFLKPKETNIFSPGKVSTNISRFWVGHHLRHQSEISRWLLNFKKSALCIGAIELWCCFVPHSPIMLVYINHREFSHPVILMPWQTATMR